MTALDLLGDMRRRGVVLTAQGDRLAFDAPAGVMTAELRATLAARKAELMAFLAGKFAAAADALLATVDDNEAREALAYAFFERAGIAEFDGGMSRPEAEFAAYLDLAQAVENLDEFGTAPKACRRPETPLVWRETPSPSP